MVQAWVWARAGGNPGPRAWRPSQGISRMQAVAYRRARKLLSSQRDQITARILGAIQSLLIVAMLGVLALLVALMASRGEARFPKGSHRAAAGMAEAAPRRPGAESFLYDDTGIFPLIPDSYLSDNPIHRAGARTLIVLDEDPADVAEQRRRAGDPPGGGADLPGADRDPLAVAAKGHGPGGDRGRHDAPATDPSSNVPAGSVVVADRGGRSGHQPLDARGQRYSRRSVRRPGRHTARCTCWRRASSCWRCWSRRS